MHNTPPFDIYTEDTPTEYRSLGKCRIVARQPAIEGELIVLHYCNDARHAAVVEDYLASLQRHDLRTREAHVSALARVLGVDLRAAVTPVSGTAVDIG